jgi:hypothetical protein
MSQSCTPLALLRSPLPVVVDMVNTLVGVTTDPPLQALLQTDSDRLPPACGQLLSAATPETDQAVAHDLGKAQRFIKEMVTLASKPILRTLVKKPPVAQGPGEQSDRRSGRLAAKMQSRGRKSSREMAQELLCKKLEGVPGQQGIEDQARNRLMKLFDNPLPKEVMEAIKDLLKVISLEDKRGLASGKVGKKAVKA